MGKRTRLLAAYYRRLRMTSAAETMRALVHPCRLREHMSNIAVGSVQERSNPYRPTFSRDEEARFCAELLRLAPDDVLRAFDELEAGAAFMADLRQRYARLHPEWPGGLHVGRFRCWYAIARLGQPDLMVETGVHDGLSSALILRAMDRNGKGTLISIDLPAMDMPAGVDGPGWLVHPSLRSRWERKLGDARKLLPEVMAEHPRIDVFIHDSDHERGHREFEFRTARRDAALGALLLSDDDADDLLDLLAGEWSGARAWVRCTLPDGDTAHLDGIRLAGD